MGKAGRRWVFDKTNIMNSVAVVESGSKVYLVTLMSNLLRINSAVEHQRIAGQRSCGPPYALPTHSPPLSRGS